MAACRSISECGAGKRVRPISCEQTDTQCYFIDTDNRLVLASNQAQPLWYGDDGIWAWGPVKMNALWLVRSKGKSLQEGKFPNPKDGAPQPQTHRVSQILADNFENVMVYFYWPPGPNPVVTISTRVGPGSRLRLVQSGRSFSEDSDWWDSEYKQKLQLDDKNGELLRSLGEWAPPASRRRWLRQPNQKLLLFHKRNEATKN